jgi:hypothetical protein
VVTIRSLGTISRSRREADLESTVRLHHVAPASADAQVELGGRDTAARASRPALDKLRRRPRLVDQVPRSVELARDEDLLVRGESVTVAVPLLVSCDAVSLL